ncbi:GMC family oxidoreductase [Arthrobacter sp. M4]|uniref:GMC family oxidoreductase n=1 Tax=Arthrobacter sp. M4 TaxID=218160 RepID=UPI001CDD6A94|nr:GMC oxidoreductase [Arthrobacter sp. M4]MCA4134829.1 GMC family oxidoreductase N-terminal domain-containing protein [Arthrobacter sp. M4]
MNSAKNTFDYVIVGGGSAGATLAKRLANDPEVSVCLIEGGPANENDPKVLMLNESLGLVGDPKYDYDYGIAPQERGNSLLRLSRAKMLGGCSAHNDCWALRAPDADMDRWSELGAEGWDAASVAPYFDQIFEDLRVHPVTKGAELSNAWIAAANEQGFETIDNTQGDYRQGISWVSLNEDSGVRVSTAVAYLFPTSKLPPNLYLQLETLAHRVVVEDGRAVAVETNKGRFEATREIILSTGAIDTPKLLMLSGIGPAEHLKQHDVEVVQDLPGVGANLSDHIETPVIWESTKEPGDSINGLDLGLYADVLQEGDFSIQVTIGHFTYWLHSEPFNELPNPPLAFTFAPNVARPASKGTIRLASADPKDKPIVDPRYFTDEEGRDERLLVEGIRLARELAKSEALKDWIVQEVAPGPELQTDEELGAYARRYSNTVYHPSATCKMGSLNDPDAVVDPRLRVRGVEGLRIADASVFPELVRVNPNMTVVMIGAKAADLIKEDNS